MPFNFKRSNSNKRRVSSDEVEDFSSKRKRTEKYTDNNNKDSKDHSSTKKSPNKDSTKNLATKRLIQLRDRIKRQVVEKFCHKDSPEKAPSKVEHDNLKKSHNKTKPVSLNRDLKSSSQEAENISNNSDFKTGKNNPKNKNKQRIGDDTLIEIIESSEDTIIEIVESDWSDTEEDNKKNDLKKSHSPENDYVKCVAESDRTSKSSPNFSGLKKNKETASSPSSTKKNKETITSQSPINQRLSKIRKSTDINSKSFKTKILNVSDKIQGGNLESIINVSSPPKYLKIPLKRNLSDKLIVKEETAEKKICLEECNKSTHNISAISHEGNNNYVDCKGFSSKKDDLMPTEHPRNTFGIQESNSSHNSNIFASNSVNNRLKINVDIKSPEINFEKRPASSPKEDMQSKHTNIFARNIFDDNVEYKESNNLSTGDIFGQKISPDIVDLEETPPCSSNRSTTIKKGALNERLKKIRDQSQNNNKNIEKDSKSTDDGIVMDDVRNCQMSLEDAPSCSGLNKIDHPNIPRSTIVENWVDSIHPTPNLTNQSFNDSMLVNVDNNTFLEKSELLADSQENISMEWDSIDLPPPTKFPSTLSLTDDFQKEKVICVVVDTNILMHELSSLEQILNVKPPGDKNLIVYVPWMVLKELDELKHLRSKFFKFDSFTAQKALAGQKFLNRRMTQSNSKIIGQSVNDVCQQLDLGKCPDDKILACCLQAQNKYDTVILLTSDINLRNKALANHVKSYPPCEIVERLENNKFFKIKFRLQEVFSDIIYHCCREVYGQSICQMKMLQNSPWDFDGCLARFKQYWQPVFSQLLLKHCFKTIDELINLIRRGKEIESDPKEFQQFVNKIKEFLFYLQDIDCFNGLVKKTRDEIDEIIKAPKEF